MANRTNPDNLTGEQIMELEKLNLLDKGMRDKLTNLPVVSSRKIAGPVKGALRNTAKDDKKNLTDKKLLKFPIKDKRLKFSIKDKPKPPKMKKRKPGEQKEMIPLAKGGRAMLRGGGICKKGMNKKAVGKNS